MESLKYSMVDTGILLNIMKFPSRECYIYYIFCDEICMPEENCFLRMISVKIFSLHEKALCVFLRMSEYKITKKILILISISWKVKNDMNDILLI